MKRTLLVLAIALFSSCVFGQTTTLSGTGTDTDGSITSYVWRKVSGPGGGTITSPTAAVTTVSGLVPGIYLYELTVTDNQGSSGADTVQITVVAGNVKPKANAGPDQIITLPPSSSFSLEEINSDLAFIYKK